MRFITYKVPVEFIQENMVLFIRTEDLHRGQDAASPRTLKDQLRRNNPFFIELRKTEPVKLDLADLIAKYSSVGKKSIRDAYYISDDKKMMMMLIKPMWDVDPAARRPRASSTSLTGGAKMGEPMQKGPLAEAAKNRGRRPGGGLRHDGRPQDALPSASPAATRRPSTTATRCSESLDDVFIWAFVFIVRHHHRLLPQVGAHR